MCTGRDSSQQLRDALHQLLHAGARVALRSSKEPSIPPPKVSKAHSLTQTNLIVECAQHLCRDQDGISVLLRVCVALLPMGDRLGDDVEYAKQRAQLVPRILALCAADGLTHYVAGMCHFI